MTALQKIARLHTKKHRKLMQSLRCLFMMPYGVYCYTLHRLRSVQSLQLPLFLKVVLSLQHFGQFVKGFCRQKKEYHNIITTAAESSSG
jgi:transposase